MAGKSRRKVGVADLAAYAADPRGFVRGRGRLGSRKAIAAGDAYHRRLGQRSGVVGHITGIAALAALAALMWWSGLASALVELVESVVQ